MLHANFQYNRTSGLDGKDFSTIYVHGGNLGHVFKIHINSGEKLIQACEKPYTGLRN